MYLPCIPIMKLKYHILDLTTNCLIVQSHACIHQWSRKQSRVAGATDTSCGCGFDY